MLLLLCKRCTKNKEGERSQKLVSCDIKGNVAKKYETEEGRREFAIKTVF